MPAKMIKTSIYLPEDLHIRLKQVAAKRKLNLTAAMETAIREWISGKPSSKNVVYEHGAHAKLAEILSSANDDAIDAVEQNIEVFLRYITLKRG